MWTNRQTNVRPNKLFKHMSDNGVTNRLTNWIKKIIKLGLQTCIVLSYKIYCIFFNSWDKIFPQSCFSFRYLFENCFFYYFVSYFFLRIKPGHVGVGCQLCKLRTWVLICKWWNLFLWTECGICVCNGECFWWNWIYIIFFRKLGLFLRQHFAK